MRKRNIYQEITTKIIKVLEQVDGENFQAPFAGLAAQGLPCNPVTACTYQGINIASLWADQQDKEFPSNEWATFKQWRGNGANVRKGETGSPIIFYKSQDVTEKDEQGEDVETNYPVLQYYTVFNAAQVEGYEHQGTLQNEVDLVTRIKSVDRFCANTGADIRHGGLRAFYNSTYDFISMPETKAFFDTPGAGATENYYAVLLHELTHWTGAPSRLDRLKAKSPKEIDKIAFEELIAELGAAFLCSKLGVVQTTRKSHAAYIKNWLTALKNDKRMIFKAAAHAARATDFLHDLNSDFAKFEIQHFTLCDGWINTQSETDENGKETPLVFDTREEAQSVIDDLFEGIAEAIRDGHRKSDEAYNRAEFRIVPIII